MGSENGQKTFRSSVLMYMQLYINNLIRVVLKWIWNCFMWLCVLTKLFIRYIYIYIAKFIIFFSINFKGSFICFIVRVNIIPVLEFRYVSLPFFKKKGGCCNLNLYSQVPFQNLGRLLVCGFPQSTIQSMDSAFKYITVISILIITVRLSHSKCTDHRALYTY